MNTLLETNVINGMKLRNRIVRSATWEGMCAPSGQPSPKLTACYENLAKGGVGLIVTGYTFVRPEGKQFPGKMGIHTDDFAPAFEALTQAVHKAGGAIAVQLVHAGGQANSEVSGHPTLAPSAVATPQYTETPEELSLDQIEAIAQAFAQGALRAKNWGFDGVQLHGAHGYLINQFLSPLTNRRTDDYGGSIENRCRFLLDVYQKVRNTVGDDYPVMIKLNATDQLKGGLEPDDALVAARLLDSEGIDAIEVSSGTPASGDIGPARVKINTPEKEAYNLELASRVKTSVSCPVMVVGGMRSYEVAETAVSRDGLDYIAMSRPLIREPGLPVRWQQGDRTPAKCISCNKCFMPGVKEGGIYCVVEKKEQRRKKGGTPQN